MSDTTLNAFVAQGTDAERIAFTPSPPTPASGPDSGYYFFVNDTTPKKLYAWDSVGVAWVLVSSGGAGILPATVQGDMLYATAANTIAALAKNATATRYLSNTGATNNPAWAQVALTTGVSGVLPVANGGSGSASGASILATQVTIPIVNGRALPTTRYELIATPGANRLIWPIQITAMIATGGAGYGNINTTSAFLTVVYGGSLYGSSYLGNDSTLTPAMTDLTDFLGTPGGIAPFLWPFDDDRGTVNAWGNMPYPEVLADLVDKPLQMLGDNSGAVNFTNGSDIIVDILYRVITTP